MVDTIRTMCNSFLDYEYLRENHEMIHFFGLGFVQLKLNLEQRLHFYHPDLPPFVDQPHNHRYDFTSEVLKGGLHNIIWREDPNDPDGEPCVLRFDSCTADDNLEIPEGRLTRRRVVAEFYTEPPSQYYMPREAFHQVRPFNEPTVTLLERGLRVTDFAQILEPVNFEPVCPFSANLPEEELWDIVKKCLK